MTNEQPVKRCNTTKEIDCITSLRQLKAKANQLVALVGSTDVVIDGAGEKLFIHSQHGVSVKEGQGNSVPRAFC